MFNHTSVQNENKCIDISSCFLNAKDIATNKYLVSKLGLNSAFFIAYNSWYKIDGKLYYYKYLKIFHELFLSELLKEYHLRNLEYKLVYSKNGIGIISESFKKEDKKYLDYDYYFQELRFDPPSNMLSLDDTFKKILTDENRIQLMNEFYRLTAFDFFTGQTDRSEGNLIFECDNKTSLAPIFDNAASLCYAPITHNSNINYKILYSRLYSAYDDLDFMYDDVVSDYNLYLFDLINENYEFYKYLCLSLDIDINEILDRTIDKYKLVVPKEDRDELLKFFDIKKNIINKTLTFAKKYK